MARMAFLGLGAMGIRMARRLVEAGHDVTTWNRSPKAVAGAATAASPRAAVEDAEIVIVIVTDNEASEAVWLGEDGAIHGLNPGTIAIESSTLTGAAMRRLDAAITEVGGRFLDAPVMGTLPHAENGGLQHLVGGEAAVLDEVRPVLEVMSGAIHHLGPVGAGTAMKLAANSWFAMQVEAMAEVLTLARAGGVKDEGTVEVLRALPATSPVLGMLVGLMVEEKFAPLFPIRLVAKDLRYASEVRDLPLLSRTAERFAEAVEAGFGDDNIHGVVKLARL